jgi:hypothetical protein
MRTSCAILCLLIASIASARPLPAEPTPREELPAAQIPSFAGETSIGTIVQHGRLVTISGHPGYSATGCILDDGSVQLLWTDHLGAWAERGCLCAGVYQISGGELVGKWDHLYRVHYNLDGHVVGMRFAHHIVYKR